MNLFAPREKFLVLEVTPKGTNGLYLSVDEDRNLIFEKFVRHQPLEKILNSPMRRVTEKRWEGKPIFKNRRKLVVAGAPSLATTIPIPLELHREHAHEKSRISVAELENMIAQEMAKIFNGCRAEAAKRLTQDDLDAIMVGARASHFKIDGRSVQDPIGFPGKKIALLLELTFTGRRLFESFKQSFNSPEGFYFAEGPQAHLTALARVRRLPLSMISADHDHAALYVLDTPKSEYPVLYREPIVWSFKDLSRAFTETLSVTEATAMDLYKGYQKGEVSEAMARAFKKMLQPAVESLLATIERAKVTGTLFFDVPQEMPFENHHKHGQVRIESRPVQELLDELGFTADLAAFGGKGKKADAIRNDVARGLVYFLEAYFDQSGSDAINRKLRRRLHWLAS